MALVLGWSYNLAWDLATNSVGPSFYCLVHRTRQGFERRLLKPAEPSF